MARFDGLRVVVTGASSGIGEATARAFAGEGAELLLLARRLERVEALARELADRHGSQARGRHLDVRDRAACMALGRALEQEGWVPDVLVNNAGLASGLASLHEGDFEDWDAMIDTNLKGLLNVTRALLPAMVARDTGHVVNIGSIAGRVAYPGGNVYNASKFAVRGLTQALNADLLGTRLRATDIQPGLVETEFSEVRFHGDVERATQVYEGFAPLRGADVAEAVVWVVAQPPHVNVQEVLIMPTDQRNPYLLDRREGGSS